MVADVWLSHPGCRVCLNSSQTLPESCIFIIIIFYQFTAQVTPSAADPMHAAGGRWVANTLPVSQRDVLWSRLMTAVVTGHYCGPSRTEVVTGLVLHAGEQQDRVEVWVDGGYNHNKGVACPPSHRGSIFVRLWTRAAKLDIGKPNQPSLVGSLTELHCRHLWMAGEVSCPLNPESWHAQQLHFQYAHLMSGLLERRLHCVRGHCFAHRFRC